MSSKVITQRAVDEFLTELTALSRKHGMWILDGILQADDIIEGSEGVYVMDTFSDTILYLNVVEQVRKVKQCRKSYGSRDLAIRRGAIRAACAFLEQRRRTLGVLLATTLRVGDDSTALVPVVEPSKAWGRI